MVHWFSTCEFYLQPDRKLLGGKTYLLYHFGDYTVAKLILIKDELKQLTQGNLFPLKRYVCKCQTNTKLGFFSLRKTTWFLYRISQ